jgi:alcohol dehydrogenase class IV
MKFIEAIKKLNEKMGIPGKLAGIKKEDMPALSKHAEREANPLYPVPKLLTKVDFADLYYQIGDWSN